MICVVASYCALLASAGFTSIPYPSGELLLADSRLGDAACVLLDLRMPEPDGIETLRRITALGSDHPPVVMITGQGDIPSAVLAIQLGATDFREKPVDDDELIEVVTRILQRRARGEPTRPPPKNAGDPRLAALTRRENQILDGLVNGLTNKQIARELEISPRTVEAHRASIMDKTRATSFSQLIRMRVGGLSDVQSRSG